MISRNNHISYVFRCVYDSRKYVDARQMRFCRHTHTHNNNKNTKKKSTKEPTNIEKSYTFNVPVCFFCLLPSWTLLLVFHSSIIFLENRSMPPLNFCRRLRNWWRSSTISITAHIHAHIHKHKQYCESSKRTLNIAFCYCGQATNRMNVIKFMLFKQNILWWRTYLSMNNVRDSVWQRNTMRFL